MTIKKAVEAEHGSATGWLAAYGDGVATFTSGAGFNSPYWVLDGVTGGGPGSWKTGFGIVIDKSTQGASGSCVNVGSANDINEKGHITVRHVECIGNGGDRDAGVSQDGFSSFRYFHTDILFEYNYIHDVGRVGIFLRGNDITIQYNWLARNETSSSQHSEGMQVSNGTDDESRQPNNIDIRYNVFEDIEGTAVISMWGHDIRIYGNVAFQTANFNGHNHNDGLGGTYFHDPKQNGNGTFSAGASSASSAKMTRDVKIFNNTFVDFESSRASIMNNSGPLTGNEVYNNLWYNCTDLNLNSDRITHDYNYFVDSTVVTETNGQSGAGDPFSDRVNQDFTLIAATDAGLTLAPLYNTDPDDVTRGADGIWDRGAYEGTAGLPVPSPPSPPNNLRVEQSSP